MSSTPRIPSAAVRALASLACIAVAAAAAACDSPAGPGAPGPGPVTTPPPAPAVRPAITSLSPDTASAGRDSVALAVHGTGFVNGAVVLWNGTPLPTGFVSDRQVTTTVAAAGLARAGLSQVTVRNPGSDTLVSGASQFRVRPGLDSLSVASVYATGSNFAFRVTVYGAGFDSTTRVRINGAPRAPEFVISPARMTVFVGGRDVAAPGRLEVAASDSLGGHSPPIFVPVLPVPASPAITSTHRLDLVVGDLAYSARSGRIYASVPSRAGARGNTLTIVDPGSGQVLASVPVGSEPRKLAVSGDGRYVYVALDGEAAVRRYDVDTGTLGDKFAIGPAGHVVEDMEVIAGAPRSIAIARKQNGVSSRYALVFDEGVQRPTTANSGASQLEPGESPGVLYGYDDEGTYSERGVVRMRITPQGVSVERRVRESLGNGSNSISYARGRIVSNSGHVVDAATGLPMGFLGTGRAVLADGVLDRAFFLYEQGLSVFSLGAGQRLGNVEAPWAPEVRAEAGSLVRWGPDGLAYRVGGQAVILRLNLGAP